MMNQDRYLQKIKMELCKYFFLSKEDLQKYLKKHKQFNLEDILLKMNEKPSSFSQVKNSIIRFSQLLKPNNGELETVHIYDYKTLHCYEYIHIENIDFFGYIFNIFINDLYIDTLNEKPNNTEQELFPYLSITMNYIHPLHSELAEIQTTFEEVLLKIKSYANYIGIDKTRNINWYDIIDHELKKLLL